MKSIIILVSVAFLSGCIATAQNRPAVASNTPYSQIGAEVYSPNETGWFLAQSNNLGVAFGKQYGSPEDTAIVNTVIFQVKGFENDSDFLTYIAEEREKQDNKKRFKILKVNNEQVSYKNTSCLKYNGLSEDHKNSGIDSNDFQYLKTVGYVCRHPSNNVIAFQMEVSHRSSEKNFLKVYCLLAASSFLISNSMTTGLNR